MRIPVSHGVRLRGGANWKCRYKVTVQCEFTSTLNFLEIFTPHGARQRGSRNSKKKQIVT